MYRYFFLLLAAAILYGCNKTEDNILWQGFFGDGTALAVKAAGDSGFVSGGIMGGKQYMMFLDEKRNITMEYKPERRGSITAILISGGSFVTAGSTDGKMSLTRVDSEGMVVWDTVFTAGFRIDHVSLSSSAGENFLAVGTAAPDSVTAGSSGLCFIRFSLSGSITARKDVAFQSFVSAKAVATDNSGNIYLGFSKLGTGGNLKATVAKYNSLVQFLWEKELYNNPAFGSASLAITLDGSDNPVVAGRTGLMTSGGAETNAFIARYMHADDSITRKYLEYRNDASAVVEEGTGQYYVLNSKCLIVNLVDKDIAVAGIIRTFSSCDPADNDIAGYSLDLTDGGNLIIAGSKGGSYYVAIKSSSALSPV